MSNLLKLPSWAKLSKHVISILGMNPGKMTLQGTNTYLIGTESSRLLIDTGEGNDEYMRNLKDVLIQEKVDKVSHILLTHYHYDHIGGVEDVMNAVYQANLHRLALIHPLSSAVELAWSHISSSPPSVFKSNVHHKVPEISVSINLHPSGYSFPHNAQIKNEALVLPVCDLSASTSFELENGIYTTKTSSPSSPSSSPVGTIRCIPTPGHTSDHMSFMFEEEGVLRGHQGEVLANNNAVIVTGDCVLGQGSSVLTDLSAYMTSLSTLASIARPGSVMLPAHGPVCGDCPRKVEEYHSHRLERIRQVEHVIKYGSLKDVHNADHDMELSREYMTCMDVVRGVYPTLSPDLHLPAAQNTMLVLDLLELQGRVQVLRCGDGHGGDIAEDMDEELHKNRTGKGCRDCERVEESRNTSTFKHIINEWRYKYKSVANL